MITCQEANELISQQLDGELNNLEENQLVEHLVVCSSCRDYRQRMITLHDILLSLPEVSLQESLVDQLIAANQFKLKENKQKEIFKKKWRPWYGIIAAALLLGLWVPISNFIEPNSNESLFGSDQKAEIVALDKASEIRGFTSESNELKINSAPEVAKLKDDTNNIGRNGDTTFNEQEKVQEPFTLQVQENEHQLVIYDNGTEVFRTNKWDSELTVKWNIDNKDEIVYTLYTLDGDVAAKYLINLPEKKEIKIED